MSASIFNADTVKVLKDKLQFKSGGKITSQGSVDPTSVATDGSVGDIYINTSTGIVYTKLVAGLNTNWAKNITSDVDQVLNSPIISNVVPPAPQVGNAWMTDTLNVKLANSTLQVGQEMYIASINNTGAPIAEASLVYQSGFVGGTPQITKAIANSEATHKVVGMATNTIADGDNANVTTYGLVRNINTVNDSEGNALTAGDILYLSATIAGGYTKNVPLNSYYAIDIGYVAEAAVSGSIFIDISHDHARDLSLLTKEPTGFDVPANVTVTYDPTAKTITLGGTYNVYWRGSIITALASPHTSVAHSATLDKVYYYYFDGTNLVWSESVWTFDMVMIAIVQYGTVDKFAIRECHGLMDWNAHQEFHRVIGTYRSSGGTLSDYDTGSIVAARRRPDISSCTINDEDIPTVNAALTTKSYTRMSLTGNTTTPVVAFTLASADIVALNGEIPFYNELSGVNWVQTPMTDNQFQALWIIAVPTALGTDSQKYRFLLMQGQSASTTLSTIQALTPADLSLGNLAALSPEYVFITKIIIRYDSVPVLGWQIISVTDLTGNRFIQSSAAAGVYLSAVEHDASLTGDGSASSPLATAYVPTTAANWATPPTTPNGALDYVAAAGIVKTQNANTIYAGPSSGGAALATFRSMVSDDIAATPAAGKILISASANTVPTWSAVGALGQLLIGGGSAGPKYLTAGTSGYHLKAAGAGADVTWNAPNTILKGVVSSVGDIPYCDVGAATQTVGVIGAVTAGRLFVSKGTGTKPDYLAAAGALGQILVGAGTTDPTWLTAGTDGYYLRGKGSANPQWDSPTVVTAALNPVTATLQGMMSPDNLNRLNTDAPNYVTPNNFEKHAVDANLSSFFTNLSNYTATAKSAMSGICCELVWVSGSANAQAAISVSDWQIGKPLFYTVKTRLVSGTHTFDVYRNGGSVGSVDGTSITVPAGDYEIKGWFIPTTGNTYALRFQASAAGTLRIDDLRVSPEKAVYANAVTDRVSYTPTGQTTTNVTYTGRYKRVGDCIECQIYMLFSGTNTQGTITFTEANVLNGLGLTVDTTKLSTTTQNSIGTWSALDSGTNGEFCGVVERQAGGTIYLAYSTGDTTAKAFTTGAGTGFPIATMANGDSIALSIKLPIVGWSSNIQVADRALEEYAFCTDTTNTDSTSSANFGYGPVGALIPNRAVGTVVNKRISFQNAPLANDEIILEVFDPTTSTWFPFNNRLSAFIGASAGNHGARILPVTGQPSQFDVEFGKYGYTLSGGLNANGDAWSVLYGVSWKWRVHKISSGMQAGSTAISARNIYGSQDSSTIPAGCIGETLKATVTTGSAFALTTYADLPGASFVVTIPGWFTISYSLTVVGTTDNVAGHQLSASVVVVKATGPTKVGTSYRSLVIATPAAAAITSSAPLSYMETLFLTADTYKIQGKYVMSAGTGSATIYNTTDLESTFQATRIA